MRKSFLAALLLAIPAAAQSTSLAAHDFVYSGESHDRRIFLIAHGQVVWSYEDPNGKREISDCTHFGDIH